MKRYDVLVLSFDIWIAAFCIEQGATSIIIVMCLVRLLLLLLYFDKKEKIDAGNE